MVAPVAMATAAAHPHNSFHSPPHGLFLANHFPRLEIDNRVSVISFHGDLSFLFFGKFAVMFFGGCQLEKNKMEGG